MDWRIPGLEELLSRLPGAVVCFSGGLDSTVLAAHAAEALPGRCAALFADLPMLSARQRRAAAAVAGHLGLELESVRIGWDGLPGVRGNGPERCYCCKRAVYSAASASAARRGGWAVLAGENADDPAAGRPGRRAGEEAGVACPLLALGIGRAEVERSAVRLELPLRIVKDTCLLTRLPPGEPAADGALEAVERCEEAVRRIAGVSQLRARISGGAAVLETDPDEVRLLDARIGEIRAELSALGFARVEVSRRGYRGP